MYLKEIRAHGFKSFADKIKIELTDGITGVVGPNGSGKSNVVDAVRWVLGEQSVKSLRGEGNMTDVIFSGSKSRNPLNVASVTLIFDNSDKYLPIDFTEVSIKRRVYKDGTNEYYLNGEKCRLKDITDILLDSGIAKESFNIISQGKIEEILSSKPNERRVIFEEAAGVLKYKKRKEDALRKLDKTHDNMNRVNDIINELSIQVEPLKIQKEQAIKYNTLNGELEGIEVSLITSDITNINYKYQQDKKRIDELNNEILEIASTNNQNEAKIEEYKLKINTLDKEIQDKQKELIDLTANVEKINSEKNIILERKKYEVEDIKLHDNLVLLKEKEQEIKNNISILELELTNRKEEIEKTKSSYDDITKEINNNQKIKNDYSIEVTNKVRLENSLKIKIDTLAESIENNSSLPYAVKSILSNPKLRGIHDVLGKLIDTDEEYSKAISISLGLSSTNVIVDDELSAKEAINYLKENNVGRVTFFPLNVIKPKGIEEDVLETLKKQKGFIGIASELVKYDKKYHNIITNQLGNVIVTDNIDSANIVSKKLNYRYKIVTLDGELLHVGGSITGGNNKNAKNIISEKYELENNIKDLEKLEKEIKILEEKINESDSTLKALEDKLYLINKDKVEKEEYNIQKQLLINKSYDELNKVQNEINGTNNILNGTLSKEEEKIINDYYEEVNKKDKVKNSLDILTKNRSDFNDDLEEFEFSNKKENSVVAAKNKELKDLEIEVNRFDVKLDNLLNTLSETYNMTYEKAITLYKLEIDEKEARSKVNSLKSQIRELGMVNLAAIEEYDRVSVRYEFLLKQREDLTKAEDTLLEIIKEMDEVMEKDFMETFKIIQSNFTDTFKELFKGGHAELKLTDPSNILETGIEIVASPPGKKLTTISLLSGGEKTFTAISLLFAILKSRPVPFCILDEVEAALDEVNVDSFGKYLIGLKSKTQFILITHKKKTMEYADILYGITMQESGVSKLVSVKLEEIK